MLRGHPSSWVGDSADPLDPLLFETVAKLKHPESVPHANPVNNFKSPSRMALHTKEYPNTRTEGFVEE